MTKFEVNIDGKVYPCKVSMGALLRFKNETGREFATVQATDVSDICVFVWCCAKSACQREKIDFPLTVMDFADSIAPEELTAIFQLMVEDSQKKMTGETKETT